MDGNPEKPEWNRCEAISIRNRMGDKPGFMPAVWAKMMYDDDNLYVIFSVSDRFVRCITDKINGPVWEDACVELFFAPDTRFPERYMNLEINCGGTALIHYNRIAGRDITECREGDIKMLEIAHTLPGIIDPEIQEPVSWIVEYRLPLALIRKYSEITRPGPGVEWKANFFKIAENSSNPHYLTWSVVDNEVPNFHLPQFFGTIRFQ